MAISYDELNRIFTIQTKDSTYQMMADRHDRLLHLYYGRKSAGRMDYLLTYADRGFSGNPYDVGNDRAYSLDALPQEYPTQGTGDYRSPALVVETESGKTGCDLRFDSYEIRDGKYSLPKLPTVYADADTDKAQTLVVTLRDPEAKLRVELLYGVLPELNIITRAAVIYNDSDEKIYLNRALSANLDFVGGDYDLMTFYGRHAMERTPQRVPVSHGEQVVISRRGTSSHQYNPLLILADREAAETAGSCYAMELVYSGGFMGMAGLDQFGQTRMQIGLSDHMFRYPVESGASFTTPETILSFSGEGLSGLSRQLHDCIRSHVVRGYWRDRVRPVLLNSWESCYLTFDAEKILNLAREAKELNLDLFVLDDGWFGKRDSDNSGLGDWFVNEKKIGDLHRLVEQIHDMGLLFGIWFEPEMISEDSDLFRAHPDWALTIPGRKPVRARNQLVLDFSRREVVDAIYDQVCRIIDMGPVDYVKWDYNRSIAEVYSQAGREAGAVLYDYILGLYDFLERLCTRYPKLLIEGCSGGGGRFDAGMLYYTPQIWCSDNTDPIDRLRIQYGTSFGYPVSSMGAHVSVSPNEQDGRVTPLYTRTVIAMSGTFGYELDPAKMSEAEKAEVRRDVARQKRYAPLISGGDYYRLTDPLKGGPAAWEIVSKDGTEVLVSIVTQNNHGNMTQDYVRLQGLDEEALYLLDDNGEDAAEASAQAAGSAPSGQNSSMDLNTAGKRGIVYGGGALMEAGLPVPLHFGEYLAYQWHFTRQ